MDFGEERNRIREAERLRLQQRADEEMHDDEY